MSKSIGGPWAVVVLLCSGCSAGLSLSSGTYVMTVGSEKPSRVQITVLNGGKFRLVPLGVPTEAQAKATVEGTIRGERLAWKWGTGEDEGPFEGRLTDNNKATGTVKVIKLGKYEMSSDSWTLAKE